MAQQPHSHEQHQSLAQDKFLLVAANLLHRAFLDCTRADAKQRFRQLCEDTELPLSAVELEDGSQARFALVLDRSEYRGRLNFSGFRNSLETLLANLAQALREERELSVFSDQSGGTSTLFGITGPTQEQGRVNVMALGADPSSSGSQTLLQLMYLDPAQFKPD